MSAKKKTPSKTAKTHAMQETISSVKDGVFGGKAVAIDRDGISELGLSIVFIVLIWCKGSCSRFKSGVQSKCIHFNLQYRISRYLEIDSVLFYTSNEN